MKSFISLTVPAGLILCGAGATSLIVNKSDSTSAQQIADEKQMHSEATYYLFLSEIEVHNKGLDGDKETDWDDDDDAPDLFYEIYYQGKRVYKSVQRDDTFIANWRGITLPVALEDLTSLVEGDININVDFEEIVDASRVKGDSAIHIKIFDNDTLTPKDDVGHIDINVADLKEGSNLITNEDRKEDNGWKNIQIEVVKREGSIKDFLLPLLRQMTQEQSN